MSDSELEVVGALSGLPLVTLLSDAGDVGGTAGNLLAPASFPALFAGPSLEAMMIWC